MARLRKVTTFKLTSEMTRELDIVCVRHGMSKDAAIRQMISYGLLMDKKIQALLPSMAEQIIRQEQAVPEPTA